MVCRLGGTRGNFVIVQRYESSNNNNRYDKLRCSHRRDDCHHTLPTLLVVLSGTRLFISIFITSSIKTIAKHYGRFDGVVQLSSKLSLKRSL